MNGRGAGGGLGWFALRRAFIDYGGLAKVVYNIRYSFSSSVDSQSTYIQGGGLTFDVRSQGYILTGQR